MDIIKTLINDLDSDNINILETGLIIDYLAHSSTNIFLNSSKNINIISIDIEEHHIKISKHINKHLNNIEWIDNNNILEILEKQKKTYFDFILLDSINNKEHIFNEFKLALQLIKLNGIIMINNFGVDINYNIPDSSNIHNNKGIIVFNILKENNLLDYLTLYQTENGTIGIFKNIQNELKNFDF